MFNNVINAHAALSSSGGVSLSVRVCYVCVCGLCACVHVFLARIAVYVCTCVGHALLLVLDFLQLRRQQRRRRFSTSLFLTSAPPFSDRSVLVASFFVLFHSFSLFLRLLPVTTYSMKRETRKHRFVARWVLQIFFGPVRDTDSPSNRSHDRFYNNWAGNPDRKHSNTESAIIIIHITVINKDKFL